MILFSEREIRRNYIERLCDLWPWLTSNLNVLNAAADDSESAPAPNTITHTSRSNIRTDRAAVRLSVGWFVVALPSLYYVVPQSAATNCTTALGGDATTLNNSPDCSQNSLVGFPKAAGNSLVLMILLSGVSGPP